MLTLVDADILVYRAGFACQRKNEEGEVVVEPLSFCLHTVKAMLENILDKTASQQHRLFLTGGGNFRNRIDPEYKANRKDTPKPIHYKSIREYLTRKWKAEVIESMEADDALGLNQTEDSVIVSIDKDLLMVEGSHYNFVKDTWQYISPEEGTRHFYRQMIMGDRVDNIPGIHGLGEKKAEGLLEASDDWDELIYTLYQQEFEDKGYLRMKQNALLLWIRQRDKKIPIDFRRFK